MSRTVKGIIISITSLILIIVAGWLFLVDHIVSVRPPLAEYTLESSQTAFSKKLEELKQKKNVNITFTDTTGRETEEPHYYFTIERQEEKFQLKYYSIKNMFDKERVQLNLIGVFDGDNQGGYENNSETTKNLMLVFNDEVLNYLK
tara:strand:+ start:722 stop:1159 length:438 start_codon:yes stop_codon:yes gene_type:complete